MSTSPETQQFRVGLALSGGGARGFAHIGVIQELERMGISIHCIAGTSAGSIVGGWYAAKKSVDEIIAMVRKQPWRSFFELKKMPWNMSAGGFLDTDKVEKKFREYLGNIRIEDLPLPFQAVAMSLKTGEEVDITSGDLVDAMIASSTVPMVFKPRKYGDDYLVDGGLVNNLPSHVCLSMGADKVIAVDLGRQFSDLQLVNEQGNLGFRPWQIYRVMELILEAKGEVQRQNTECKDIFVLHPYISHISHADFGRIDDGMLSGRRVVEEQEDALRQFLGMKAREKSLLQEIFEG